MFVLQECSICFEDFSPERYPHCIPCGHIFCNPCLESLLSFSTTARCPNCRIRYASNTIRKLICPLQDPHDVQKLGESQAETIIWETIQSVIESPEHHEERRLFVEHNSVKAVMAAGMSVNLLTALCVMTLLVQVEERNGTLEDELSQARVVEQSLCDRISTLQTQPYGAGTTPNSSADGTQSLRLLMSDIWKIQSAIETIGKDTAKVARHFSEEPEPSTLPRARNTASRSDHPILASSPVSSSNAAPINTTRSPSQGRSTPIRISPPNLRPPVPPPVRPRNIGRRPPPLNLSNPISRQNTTEPQSDISAAVDEPRSTANQSAVSQDSRTLDYSVAQLLLPTALLPTLTPLNFPQMRSSAEATIESSVSPDRSGPPSTFTSNTPARERPLAPSFRPLQLRASASRSRTLTVLRDYTAQEPNELSLKQGEKLYLLLNSDTSREWIWCKDKNGATGYASKQYVKIDSA